MPTTSAKVRDAPGQALLLERICDLLGSAGGVGKMWQDITPPDSRRAPASADYRLQVRELLAGPSDIEDDDHAGTVIY
jgi:hypothetical protein